LDESTITGLLGSGQSSGMQIEAELGAPDGLAGESLLFRIVGFAMDGLMTVFLISVSVYFFTRVPVLLWKITARFFIGSFAWRLLSRVAHHDLDISSYTQEGR
jgi:hypothetical protein